MKRVRHVLQVTLQLTLLGALFFLVSYERRHQEVLKDMHESWSEADNGASPPSLCDAQAQRRERNRARVEDVVALHQPIIDDACRDVLRRDRRECVEVASASASAILSSSTGTLEGVQTRLAVDLAIRYVAGAVESGSFAPAELAALQARWQELALHPPPLGPPLASAIAGRGCDWRTWTFLSGEWSDADGTSIWQRRHFALHADEWFDCDTNLGACLQRYRDEAPRGAPRCSGEGTDYFGLCCGPLSEESRVSNDLSHAIDLRARLRLLAVWLAAVARDANKMAAVPEWRDPRLADPYTSEPFRRHVRGEYVELTAQLEWGSRSLPLR